MIRPAQPNEAAVLSALALRSKAVWGYDAAFMAACVDELAISADKLQRQPAYVIEDNGRLLGFYLLEPLNKRTVELGYLFVEPAAIGQGYGRSLMRHAQATASLLGYSVVIIQSDPHAAQFYRAMGGELIGYRPSASIPGRDLPLFRIDLER